MLPRMLCFNLTLQRDFHWNDGIEWNNGYDWETWHRICPAPVYVAYLYPCTVERLILIGQITKQRQRHSTVGVFIVIYSNLFAGRNRLTDSKTCNCWYDVFSLWRCSIDKTLRFEKQEGDQFRGRSTATLKWTKCMKCCSLMNKKSSYWRNTTPKLHT